MENIAPRSKIKYTFLLNKPLVDNFLLQFHGYVNMFKLDEELVVNYNYQNSRKTPSVKYSRGNALLVE